MSQRTYNPQHRSPHGAFATGTASGLRRLLLVCLVAGLGSLPTVPALADPEDWLDNNAGDASTSSFVATQPGVSAAQAAAWVRRAHGGRVLSVNPSRRGDVLGYKVRVLVSGGRVKTVYVDSTRIGGSGQSSSPVRPVGDQ